MPFKRFFANTRKWVKNTLYAQALIVVLAFALMVFLSYHFMSKIEREHLISDVNNAILNTHTNIVSEMLEPETMLDIISENVRHMLLEDDDFDTVSEYITSTTERILSNERHKLYITAVYGVFDIFDGKFYTGVDWTPPDDYIAKERPWYKAAVEADGKVVSTEPYLDAMLGVAVMTFTRCLFDDDGRQLGVVCLDISLDKIKEYAVNTHVTEGSYGILLNSQFIILAHPHPAFIGKVLHDLNIDPFIEEELREGKNIVERKAFDYNGEPCVLFIQQLENGWYMAIIAYAKEHYQSVRNIARILTTLGAVLAAILSIILIRIIREKNKSEERIQAILNAMPLCTNIWNKKIELIDCNNEALRLFELSSKKELLDNFKKLSPEYQPDGRLSKEKSFEFIKEAFEKGYCRVEWLHQKLNGDPIPCDITLIRIKLHNDFFVAAYMLDLRELKSAIAKMREVDERTQIIFDTAPIGSLMFDKDFNIYDCNQEIVNMLELPNKHVFLERFFELSPEYQPCGRKSSEMVAENNSKVFNDGFCRFEWMHQTLSGKPVPCEITHVRVKYKDEYAIAAYARDLREHKALLNELHNENEKNRTMAHWYESLLDAIPFLAVVQDLDKNCTFINMTAETTFGINRADFIGKPCGNLNLEICNTDDCAITCAKRGRMRTYFSYKDDSYQVDSKLLKDLNEKTIGYIEVIQDITQLEQITKRQAEAEAANTAKSTFLARVSHEIRTPMNAILGITEIQLQNENLQPDVQEALGTIYNSGYLLLGIINDILDLSKIEAGRLELAPVNYDVASLINDTIHLNIMRYDSKPIEFLLQLDENIPTTLFGDDLRIKQILNNLLSNSFKYTDGGQILFSIAVEYNEQKSDQVTLVFRVKDTGQGMTKDQVEKLFDEYTRFNTNANRTTIGTGLGMTITKHLVQIMNGVISVESEPGKGSMFTVRLPQGKVDDGMLGKDLAENLQKFRVDKKSQMKKAPQIVREYMPYGKVLVVDDVETNLYVAKGLLAPYGLAVETASSGFEAVDKIKNGCFYDIIFMDHFMPKMDGMEAEKIIRGLNYEAPIIALTANALAGQAELFMANGFDGFISKPIDIRQLNIVLNKFIRDKYPGDVIQAARLLKDSMNKQSSSRTPRPLVTLELAGIFIRDAERTIAALEAIHENNYRRTDDLQTYIINVHAIKSALANIGEAEISDFALKLEQAGRDEDIALIMKESPEFLKKLKTVIEKLKPKEDSINSDGEESFLFEKLAAIQAACQTYDIKTAKDALTEIRQKTWPRPVKESLNAIAEHLLHSEFEKAADIISSLL